MQMKFYWIPVFFLELVPPLTWRKSKKDFCHKYRSMTLFLSFFFFSLLIHPFPISTLVIILLIQWTKVSLSSFFINQIHLRFALALTFKTQQKSFSALSEKKIYRIYLKQFHLQRGHTAILRSIVKWSPCSPMTGCLSITLINKVTGNDRIIVKNVWYSIFR